MVHIERVAPDEFDWTSEQGPAAEVRRVARAATANDGTSTLNEQALLQLKHRGLRDASLWLGEGGFALRHSDVLDLAVHPESRRQGVGTALAADALPEGPMSTHGHTAITPAPRAGGGLASGVSANWRSCGGPSQSWSRSRCPRACRSALPGR